MYEPSYHHHQQQQSDENDLINEKNHLIDNDDLPVKTSRTSMHRQPQEERECDDMNIKQQINTDTAQFDALFARSNASPPPSPHPRCYSSCSPSTVPFQIFTQTSKHNHAKSHPYLSSSASSSRSAKQQQQQTTKQDRRSSTISSNKSPRSSSSLSNSSAQMKRQTFSLTHAAQTFLQSTNSQSEPLARSCSYKRPQSIKKYRQQKRGKEKEKEQKEYFSSRKSSTYNNNILHTVVSNSARKSISGATSRVSATDLMANDDLYDQWSNPKSHRSARVGSLPLDQLQLPQDVDEEIYRVRQFHTTSKGFVNRGDSFKRSFKRNGSISRRSSIRKSDLTPSQEHLNNELRTSSNSLTNSNLTAAAGPNLSGILDTNFHDTTITNDNTILSSKIDDRDEENVDDDDDDDNDEEVIVERIETEDGRVQNIRIYQVYLLGMSGTGKCSLLRQFKTTEYRGIYDYSSSVEEDPDNTVSIMLDGIESRLHVINIDIDLVKCSVTGDAYIVVYSITDRQSFQTAIQLIKNIREKELADQETLIKRYVPIILVGNKSDLVRKRAVTKETARNAAFRYDCKFVETSAAINDKVDDLLAGTLKQIRINDEKRIEQRRRLTITNGAINSNEYDSDLLNEKIQRKNSTISPNQNNSKNNNIFSKFFNVFRKKPTRLPADVENLNVGIR